jgi:precorrin-6x reductase
MFKTARYMLACHPIDSNQIHAQMIGMYVRRISRKNKDDSLVEYIQLAQNYWDQQKKQSQTQVIYTLGRKDELDLAAIQRLVHSLSRLLPPEEASQAQLEAQQHSPVELISSRPA